MNIVTSQLKGSYVLNSLITFTVFFFSTVFLMFFSYTILNISNIKIKSKIVKMNQESGTIEQQIQKIKILLTKLDSIQKTESNINKLFPISNFNINSFLIQIKNDLETQMNDNISNLLINVTPADTNDSAILQEYISAFSKEESKLKLLKYTLLISLNANLESDIFKVLDYCQKAFPGYLILNQLDTKIKSDNSLRKTIDQYKTNKNLNIALNQDRIEGKLNFIWFIIAQN